MELGDGKRFFLDLGPGCLWLLALDGTSEAAAPPQVALPSDDNGVDQERRGYRYWRRFHGKGLCFLIGLERLESLSEVLAVGGRVHACYLEGVVENKRSRPNAAIRPSEASRRLSGREGATYCSLDYVSG